MKLFTLSVVNALLIGVFLFTGTFNAEAAEPIVFTVPFNVEHLKPDSINSRLELLVGCFIGAPNGAEKGVGKVIVPLVNGGYQGQLQISVTENNPSQPFAKGDKWFCSANLNGNGWANIFYNYLSPSNQPAAGLPLQMVVGGTL